MKCSQLVFVLGCVVLPACMGCPGQKTDDTNDQTQSGPTQVDFTAPQNAPATVKLPAGVTTDLTTLKVATNAADTPVNGDGSTVPQVIVNYPSLVLLVGPNDKALLMAFLTPGGANQEISAKSTSTALLFFALGGWNLPPENLQNVLNRIAASPAGTTLAAAIEAAMASNPTALTDGAQGITDAINAGAQALINDDTPGSAAKAIRDAKSVLPNQLLASNFQLLLSPEATTIQSGVQVLQNPDGDGVIAQNNFRRRGVMYAYLTGTKDDQGTLTPVDPPRLTGEPVEIPTTYSLGLVSSFKQAAQNLVGAGGVAPWSPIRTGPLVLPREGEASQTLYKVVVIGPAFDAFGPHNVLADPTFASFHSEWNEKIVALSMQTFVEDFVFRILEFIAVAGPASASKAGAAQALADYRRSLDPFLLAKGLSIPLSSPAKFRQALQFILQDAANPGEISLKPNTLKFLQSMWGVNNAVNVKVEQLEANLGRAARIGGLLVAIDAALTGLDLGAVLHDLGSSFTSEAWDATVVPRKVIIDPTSATVTKSNLTVGFTGSVQQNPNGIFLYRWKCTATHGHLNDYLSNKQDSFDTGTSNGAFYIANPDAEFNGSVFDTVTVSLYESDGSGKISNNTNFIGSATATITGEKEQPVPTRWFLGRDPRTSGDIPQNSDFCYHGSLGMDVNGRTFFGGGSVSTGCYYGSTTVSVDLYPGSILTITFYGFGPDTKDISGNPICYLLDPLYLFTQTNDFKLDKLIFVTDGFPKTCADQPEGVLLKVDFKMPQKPDYIQH